MAPLIATVMMTLLPASPPDSTSRIFDGSTPVPFLNAEMREDAKKIRGLGNDYYGFTFAGALRPGQRLLIQGSGTVAGLDEPRRAGRAFAVDDLPRPGLLQGEGLAVPGCAFGRVRPHRRG